MAKPQIATLFIGGDSDSDEAKKIVESIDVDLSVVDCKSGYCDFEPPLLISAWGVFDGLRSIKWFGQLTAQDDYS